MTNPPPGWWMASDGQWYPPVAPTTNSKAVVALVLGIVGVTGCGCFTGIPAIFVGRQAKEEIDEAGGRQSGEGLATAGIVLGWVTTGLAVLGLLVFLGAVIVGSMVDSDSDDVPPPTISVPR